MRLTMPEKKNSDRRFPLLPVAILAAAVLAAVAGGLYWHYSGRLVLEGRLRSNAIRLLVKRSGVIAAVAVVPGQRVRKGDALLRLDDAPLRRALAEEEEKLARMRRLLPPDALRVPAEDRTDGHPDETMAERLERQRSDEAHAERLLQEATDNEAQASVLYSRISLLAARKKIPRQERDAAEASLEAARREVRAAREYFASVSQARAATGAEMRRIREARAAAGADGLSVDALTSGYARQAERVAEARADLAAAFLLAPEDGLIVEAAAREGDRVEDAHPCFLLQADARPAMVRASAGESAARKLAVGQQCRILFAGPQEILADGYIAALLSDAGSEKIPPIGTAVWIALTADGSGSPLAAIADDAEATVTVLLREPLSPMGAGSPPRPLSAAPAPPAGPEHPAPGAPLPAPLSVQSPFGEDPARMMEEAHGSSDISKRRMPPPMVKAGSPEASGRPAAPDAQQANRQPSFPSLPPMDVPERLTGSPLPDPLNNPSLTTPDILEKAAIEPR